MTAEMQLSGDEEQSASALLEAALGGDTERVEELLHLGVGCNFTTADGFSPLIYAAKGGHLLMVKALLEAGAYVNPNPGANHTATRAASLFGHADVLHMLLVGGADPNQPSANGKTALMGACMNGHAEIARMLLVAGADASAVNDYGESAADLAALSAQKGQADCRPILAEHSVYEGYVRPEERPLVDPKELLTQVAYMLSGVGFLVIVGLICRHIDSKLVPPKEEL